MSSLRFLRLFQTQVLRRWRTLCAWFLAYDADEPEAGRFRARQLQAVLRLTPAAMLVNVLNVTVINVAIWPQAPHAPLAMWSLLVLALAGQGFRGWWLTRRRPERHSASRRALRRATWQAALLGLTWGALPAMVFAVVDPGGRFLVGTVATGMICAGGFALSSVPWAGTAYVLALTLPSMWAVLSSGMPLAGAVGCLLGLYSAMVAYSVWTYAKTLGARLVAEATAARQNEVIGLLLKDFEEHASDLLLELDTRGRFVHASPRLAQALGVPAARLARLPAWALLRRWMPADEAGRAGWVALQANLAAQKSFRDLHLALETPAGPRWWSLSARPLQDERGQPRGWRGVASDITDKQLTHRRLSWLANNDSLTGLVNRHQFRELLQSLLHNPVPQALALVCFDLDGFKQINDSRGHAAGDRLLADFGQRLLSIGRRSDTVARLGGDEFAMLVRGVSQADEVAHLLDRLQAVLATPCEVAPGHTESLRTSMGVALAPADGRDVDTLLSHADLALYAAKHAGGNRYSFFSAQLTDSNRRRASLAQALRGAVGRGELRLAFQPQIAAVDQQLCGFEALLRWRHPELGEVPPAEFVPIAEGAGLMPEIGRWVLHTAAQAAAQWPRPLKLAINVSALQLGAPDFVAQVQAATAALAPQQVELEVTESVLIEDPDATVAKLHQLRSLGFKTALDDFGTGYSALSYLRRFPFDTLKIDRSFVHDLTRNGEAEVLVDTILAMARALRMRTVAEGVETLEEAQMLSQRGCAELQGYLISRPLAADAVGDFIRQWQGLPSPRVLDWTSSI